MYVFVLIVYLEMNPCFSGRWNQDLFNPTPMAKAVEAGTSPEAESDLGLQAPWLVLCQLKPQPPPVLRLFALCDIRKVRIRCSSIAFEWLPRNLEAENYFCNHSVQKGNKFLFQMVGSYLPMALNLIAEA